MKLEQISGLTLSSSLNFIGVVSVLLFSGPTWYDFLSYSWSEIKELKHFSQLFLENTYTSFILVI